MATTCTSSSPDVLGSGRPKALTVSPALTPVGVAPFWKYFVLGETSTVWVPCRLLNVTVEPATLVTRPLTF